MMIKRGQFWGGKPFVYHDKQLFIGDRDEFHIDTLKTAAANLYEDHLEELWMQGEVYTGRIWENPDGMIRQYDVDGAKRLTATTLKEIDTVLKKHYGADDDAPLEKTNGISFTGAVVLQGLPPATGKAVRPDKFPRREIEALMKK